MSVDKPMREESDEVLSGEAKGTIIAMDPDASTAAMKRGTVPKIGWPAMSAGDR